MDRPPLKPFSLTVFFPCYNEEANVERVTRTALEVAREVARHVDVFAPGGGYVFASVHNVQASVPPENLIAMFDAVRAKKS